MQSKLPEGVELRDLTSLWGFSQMVAKSGLAPKGMTSADAVAVAIQLGLEAIALSRLDGGFGVDPTHWYEAMLKVLNARLTQQAGTGARVRAFGAGEQLERHVAGQQR